jgi:pyruvate formate lyase activating enzyme
MAQQSEKGGLIFKVKRFSIHDGPGIRTSVFLKGCPLNCIWCHSPEGKSYDISIWYNQNLCIGCGKCVKGCPTKALELTGNADPHIKINRRLCNISGKCVNICPTSALQFTGSETTVSEIINEIEIDQLYYESSGGGVTLTGGEPLFQPDFSAEILSECRKRKIHTAIETSLFTNKESINIILDKTDLFIVDIKIYDPVQHKRYTGQPNEIIKENFRYIAAKGKAIQVRIPLIENITNTEDNLKAIAGFVRETRNDIQIEKISYNPLACNNYKKLGIPFLLE